MVDPMNVSGLALSALTLPAQVFSSGVVAYTTISQVKGMGSSFNRHYCHFKVEESRYIYWGMCHRACTPAGFLPNQMPRMIYDTLVQTLVLINDILTDRDKLWSKYGLEQVGMGDEAEPSVIKRESMRQQNEITRLQKASKLVRKIKWAVKDEAKFGLMISEMSSLIRTLYEILPVPGGVRVEDTISAHALSNILLDGAVQQAQQGLQQMPAISMERQMMTAHNTANVRATVESSDGMPPPTSYRAPASRLLLDINQLTIAAQDNIPRSAISVPGLRSLARPRQANAFSGNDLLVEWLRYDLQRDRSFGMNVKAALNIRVEALATMLEAKPRSDSFRRFAFQVIVASPTV
ncbi:hypothetical protein GLAREA_06299 [Glarea lozoyensis ATCC 20868]|uniref:Prion-inhibition and propagation HeLo domain-containing protein n=1 Tax=Glarea lozoyensis (strain ATCC 20868 / MF5171) TaxID=1116229 RepID=S3D4D6_GLAL2|nr:uncharacterized protein GLAREA_06299 [Glarea lozoyensis ATCC 20868]EPE33287.1 hypothetical protein GLAREA_06299 [Glarea lozoyensis ATCC 20868]